jgi:hypothetical protein
MILNHKRYGSVEIEPAGEYQAVSSIHSKTLDKSILIDIDTAEKITLIAENDRVYVSTCFPDLKNFFILHYKSSSVAVVCRLVRIDFNDKLNAREILARPTAYSGPMVVS